MTAKFSPESSRTLSKRIVLPEFRVADVFPRNDKMTALMRFVVTTRPLISVARADHHLPEDLLTKTVDAEQLMLGSIADAKEALDAFREADQLRCFAGLQKVADAELKARLRRLRLHSNPNNPRSLYKRVILWARYNAGGHWSLKLVGKALEEFKDESVPAWVGEGKRVIDGYIPLAHAIVRKISKIWDRSKAERQRLSSRIAQIQGDLFHVADAAYAYSIGQAQRTKAAK